MKRVWSRAAVSGLVLAMLGLASAAPVAAAVPFDIQIPLLLKALTYDRSLKNRVGDQVRIAVLSPPGRGTQAFDALTASLASLPAGTIAGVPVTFKAVATSVDVIDSLDLTLRSGRWAAIYTMPGFSSDDLRRIQQIGESRRVLLVAAAADDVERGNAFGIGERDGKPMMVVNLPVTKACGSDFDLALLRLAKVIQ